MNTRDEAWPDLALSSWRPTYDTLHLWLQIVGKTRLALSPHCNHWWEAPLYLTARGLTTSPIPYENGAFEIRCDFQSHLLIFETSWGAYRVMPLAPRSVAGFYGDFFTNLRELGVQARIWPMPVEIPGATRLDLDDVHRSYDPEYARRCWRALLTVDAILKEFRGRFVGKESPVHFFWGSFDLALTRFSGRRAPPREGADFVTREAYSHEVVSFGWWPGDGRVDACFYAYAAPEPRGFAASRPAAGAAYDGRLKEFLLPYEQVRRREDPKAAVLDFFQEAYEAGASLGGWDRTALDRPRPWPTV